MTEKYQYHYRARKALLRKGTFDRRKVKRTGLCIYQDEAEQHYKRAEYRYKECLIRPDDVRPLPEEAYEAPAGQCGYLPEYVYEYEVCGKYQPHHRAYEESYHAVIFVTVRVMAYIAERVYDDDQASKEGW